MKILFVNTLYYPQKYGGAEISLQLQAEELTRQGHSCVVVASHEEKETRVSTVNSVRVYHVPSANVYWGWGKERARASSLKKMLWHGFDIYNHAMGNYLSEILEKENPDLVNTQNIQGFSVSTWSATEKFGVPIVHTMHDQYLLCPKVLRIKKDGSDCKTPCFDCKVFSFPKQKLTGKVKAVVGVSNFILDVHLKAGLFPNASRHVVSAILSEENFRGPERKSNPSQVRFGFLGLVSPFKGTGFFLEGLTSLKDKNWSAGIAGDGNPKYFEFLKEKYPSPNIEYVGYTPAAEFLGTVDVLVATSQFAEPSARVITEAHAKGVPTIVSNKGGCPELVVNGKTGFIVSNQEELVAALQKFISDPSLSKKMREACIQHASQFRASEIAKKYLEIFSLALDQKNPALDPKQKKAAG